MFHYWGRNTFHATLDSCTGKAICNEEAFGVQ